MNEPTESEHPASGSYTRGPVDGRRRLSLELKFLLRPFGSDLVKDTVHDGGGQKDFTVRYRDWRTVGYGAVETLDQIAHAGFRVEVPCEKSLGVHSEVR